MVGGGAQQNRVTPSPFGLWTQTWTWTWTWIVTKIQFQNSILDCDIVESNSSLDLIFYVEFKPKALTLKFKLWIKAFVN